MVNMLELLAWETYKILMKYIYIILTMIGIMTSNLMSEVTVITTPITEVNALWNASNDGSTVGYSVHLGTTSHTYINKYDTIPNSYSIKNLEFDKTYYIAVQ